MFTLAKRIFFFLLTNIAVLALLSFVLGIVWYFFPDLINSYGWLTSVMIYAVVLGFAWSFISLFLSRWMAKRTYSITLLDAESAARDGKLKIVWDTVVRISQIKGITMPEVGYYESAEPNAFATGPSKNSALVAVSTGLLNSMDKNEIEWVVGHEMAHILNGDMVTLTLLQWVMNTFVIFLSTIAARLVASFLSRWEGDNAISYFAYQMVYMLFQMAFGFLAMFVVMWFSRIREYRADFGGAEFTSRSSMISSLKKLKSLSKLEHTSPEGNLTAFMINEPDSMFSTHPSLENRIKALEENYQLA